MFFATIFRESATHLDSGALDAADARALAEVADKIVFEGIIPW